MVPGRPPDRLRPALRNRIVIDRDDWLRGRGFRRLAVGAEPAWSPRGDAVAFMRFGPDVDMLYTLPATGGPAHPLGPGEYPDWSPDGGALAFDRDGQIWLASPDGTYAHKLGAGQLPRFSPDAKHIAFIRNGNADVMDRNGSHVHIVANTGDLFDFDPMVDEIPYVFCLGWQPLP